LRTLLALPNCSAGEDAATIAALARAFDARLLDVHSDPDHNRSVFTLAGTPQELPGAVLNGARRAVQTIDVSTQTGAHPRIGAIDVAPIVYLSEADRGGACAAALVLADMLGEELALPVFLYGALGGGRTRAQLRRGGPAELGRRIARGQLHPTAGAVLVAARAPLVAFNVELAAPAGVQDARRIAALIREGGAEGLTAVRAIGVWLSDRSAAQVSTNVEDHMATRLVDVVGAIARHAPIAEAELVGLAPQSAFDGFPIDIVVRNRRTIEELLPSIAPRAH
jgi:glutamate formiminotransferase